MLPFLPSSEFRRDRISGLGSFLPSARKPRCFNLALASEETEGVLEGHLLVWAHKIVNRNRRHKRFEIQEIQRILQTTHEFRYCLFIDMRPSGFFALHLDSLVFRQRKLIWNICEFEYSVFQKFQFPGAAAVSKKGHSSREGKTSKNHQAGRDKENRSCHSALSSGRSWIR